ncbi:hypothetical protein Thivi_3612 [Thiocystis violascens DSM 198]|uniref:Uncharacterized protein n=1 Tax=Thiocystis violascens (strain ATCC 17096 / DSM 198 / 6111) TaxID=765911 RepID=I3YEP9_THIV6|nr:hypothetical protein Thivi_3612 [Thiocystis violascens DSM 198]
MVRAVVVPRRRLPSSARTDGAHPGLRWRFGADRHRARRPITRAHADGRAREAFGGVVAARIDWPMVDSESDGKQRVRLHSMLKRVRNPTLRLCPWQLDCSLLVRADGSPGCRVDLGDQGHLRFPHCLEGQRISSAHLKALGVEAWRWLDVTRALNETAAHRLLPARWDLKCAACVFSQGLAAGDKPRDARY